VVEILAIVDASDVKLHHLFDRKFGTNLHELIAPQNNDAPTKKLAHRCFTLCCVAPS
jgi:hypothetical protein